MMSQEPEDKFRARFAELDDEEIINVYGTLAVGTLTTANPSEFESVDLIREAAAEELLDRGIEPAEVMERVEFSDESISNTIYQLMASI